MEKLKKQAISQITWRPWVGVVMAFLIFGLAYIFTALAGSFYAGFYASWKNISDSQATEILNGSTPVLIIAYLVNCIAILAFVVGFIKIKGAKISAIGITKPKPVHLVYGVLATPLYYLTSTLIFIELSILFPNLNLDQKQDIGFNNVGGPVELTLLFILLAIIVPITEEVLFRGLMYTSFRKALPFIWAGLYTSIIFGMAHYPDGGLSTAISIGVLSLFLVFLREKTGNIWGSVMLHGCNNAMAFLFVFVLKLN